MVNLLMWLIMTKSFLKLTRNKVIWTFAIFFLMSCVVLIFFALETVFDLSAGGLPCVGGLEFGFPLKFYVSEKLCGFDVSGSPFYVNFNYYYILADFFFWYVIISFWYLLKNKKK